MVSDAEIQDIMTRRVMAIDVAIRHGLTPNDVRARVLEADPSWKRYPDPPRENIADLVDGRIGLEEAARVSGVSEYRVLKALASWFPGKLREVMAREREALRGVRRLNTPARPRAKERKPKKPWTPGPSHIPSVITDEDVQAIVELRETLAQVGARRGVTREAVRLRVVRVHPGWRRWPHASATDLQEIADGRTTIEAVSKATGMKPTNLRNAVTAAFPNLKGRRLAEAQPRHVVIPEEDVARLVQRVESIKAMSLRTGRTQGTIRRAMARQFPDWRPGRKGWGRPKGPRVRGGFALQPGM